MRNRPFKKTQIIKIQSRALSRSLISEYPGYSLISEPITAREKHYSLVGYMLTEDIYRAAERRGKYLTLVTDTEGIIVLVFAQSVNIDMKNLSFKCSKIVKNALYLKKSALTVTHECQKVNSVGYLLLIVQSERA